MSRKNNRADIILILFASFFYMACPMMTTPLVPGFAESLGANGLVMGIVGGLMNVTSLICRPLAGNLADRISKYKMSCAGAAFTLLASLGYVLANGNALLLVARICHGIGFSCLSICMATWLAELLPRGKVGFGMGLYGTINALSMAVMPAVGIQVYERFGYHAAFALAIAFSLLTALIIQFIKDRGEPIKETKKTEAHLALIDHKVMPIALIMMLFAIPYCATQSFLVSYAEALNLAVPVSLFFPLYALALLVLRLGLKSYFDKVPYKVFLILGAASAACSLLALAFLQGYATMIVAALCMAGGYGIMCSVSQSTAILLADPGKDALANSTYYVGMDLGMALGPIIGGVLYGHVDIHYFYPTLLLTVPLCLLVGIFAGKTIGKANVVEK